MKEYLLSVIIPTKNRQYYALNSIRQIQSICGHEVEIVVQDNSDDDTLKKGIDNLDKSNIVYNHKEGIISFVDNFDLAINLSSGKYLMIIGDDDGITSLALRVARWADNTNVCAVKPALSFVYFWPNSKVFEHEDNGILNIYNYDGCLTMYNPRDGVKLLLENSCQNYLDGNLIKLYHGIVRRDLLEGIKKRTSRYVGGLSPDIYLSVALSLLAEKEAVDLHIPVTISGICTGSGSSQSATGEHTGILEDAPHFRGHTNYSWSKRIPRFYSVETIWGDSAMAAIEDISSDFADYYKAETLTYRCLRKYPSFKNEIMNNYTINNGSKINLGVYFASRILNRIFSPLKHKAENKPVKIVNNLSDILAASVICEKWIEEYRYKINTGF